jgi:hypothetical protein
MFLTLRSSFMDIVIGGIVDLTILLVVILYSVFLSFLGDMERQQQNPIENVPVDPIPRNPDLPIPAPEEEIVEVENEDLAIDNLNELIGVGDGIITTVQYFFVAHGLVLLILFFFIMLPNMFGMMSHKLLFNTWRPEPIQFNISRLITGTDYFLEISILKTLLMGGLIMFSMIFSICFGIDAIVPNVISAGLKRIIIQGLTFLKVSFFVFSQFIFIPMYLGVSLDYFTTDFLGLVSEGILSRFWKEPVIFAAIHWMLGLFLLFQISITFKTFREFLRPQALWFLNNPEDPQFNFFREVVRNSFFYQFRRTVMTILLFTTIILAFARTPLKLCKSIFPDLFPIQFSMRNPFIQSSLDVGLFYLFTLAFDRINPLIVMKSFYKYWMEKLGTFLDLNEYLFPIGEMRKPNMFHMRIIYLLFFIWMTGIAIVSVFFVVPLYTGIFVAKFVDLELSGVYLHLIGSYVCIGIFGVVSYLAGQVLNFETVMRVTTTSLNVGGSVLLFALMPYLFGAAFMHTFLFPFFGLDVTLIFAVAECWSFGLILMAGYFRLLIQLPIAEFENPRRALQHVTRNGILGVKFIEVLSEVVFPEVYDLGLFVMIPYCICGTLIPSLVELTTYEMTVMSRFVYLTIFVLQALIFLTKKFFLLLSLCRQRIVDWNNVVERRLLNVENVQ